VSAYAGRGLHGQMVEQIGARIVRGHYEPGAALYAEALEQEFGVSKTVVREALRVLAAKGLVETRQKRGTVVRPRREWGLLDSDVLRWQGGNEPDFTFLENLAEVRAIIEPAAARLAAQRRTEADLTAMDDALAAMVAADADAISAADVRFHRGVLDAAHNELLGQMEVVLAVGLQLRDEFVHHSQGPSDSIPAHRALLEAIRAQDEVLAGKTVEDLLAQASEDLAAARRKSERSTRRKSRTA
jgi:GntR family transcriptional regulator, galactonate operon transcriptional repressor